MKKYTAAVLATTVVVLSSCEPPPPPPGQSGVEYIQHDTYPFSDCQDSFWQPGGVNSRWNCTPNPLYPTDDPQDVGAWTNVLQDKPETDLVQGVEDSYLVASGLSFPRGHGYYMRVRHAFSMEKGAGGRFEMKTAEGWEPIEPMAGYPGVIEADGTSLDGEAGFTGTSSANWWQTDLFDLTSAGNDIPTVRFHLVRSAGQNWWTIDAVDLVLAAYARPTPSPAIRERRSNEVVNELNSNLHTKAVETLGSINQQEIPEVVNSFEWYGIDPNSLVANYGPFNTPTELKTPRWSFKFARNQTFISPVEAASYFVSRVVPRLFGVANPGMVLVAESQQASQNQQRSVFKYHQQFAGKPVNGASLVLELEGQEKLYRASSTLVPGLQAPIFASVRPDPAVELVKDHLVTTLGIDRSSILIEDVMLEYVTGSFINKGVIPYITYRVEYVLTFSGESGTTWVDGWSTGVLKTSSRTRYLNVGDRISDASSMTIGGGGWLGGDLWQGDPTCGHTGFPAPSYDACCLGSPTCLQDNEDIYETQMAYQHIENYFSSLSPDVCGTRITDWRSWISVHPQLLAGVGATAEVSIGVNDTSTGRTTYAQYTAVPEVVGHEIGHSVNRSGMTNFEEETPGTWPFWEARTIEGSAIDEAMGDHLGVIIESLAHPGVRDDIWASGDDDKTRTTISGIGSTDNVPCRGQWLPWRSISDPHEPNGGWCPGVKHYRDMLYTSYDAYSSTGYLYIDGTYVEKYVGGHTSLGIYDYLTYLVGSDPGDSLGAEGFDAPALGHSSLREFYPKVLCFMNGDDSRYSDYVDVHDAWSRAGLWLDGRDIAVLGTYESAARTAGAAVGLWQPPQLVHVATGMMPGGHILTDQIFIDGRFKPAVASFLLEDGATERVFVFYRPTDSLESLDRRILYIYQDRPTSLGDYETPAWRGPYEVPGALTAYGPTATSSDDIVVVAWNHRNPSGIAGGVRGAYMKFDSSSAPGGGVWQDLPATGSQRMAIGTPSIAYWSPKGYRVDCGGLSLTGITPYPFESLGPYGDTFADCYEMSEDPGSGSTPPSLIPVADSFVMYEQMREMLNTGEARATPAVYDFLAPRRTDEYINSSFKMHLRPQTTDQPSEVDIIAALPGQVGEHWTWLQESSNPLAHAHADFRLDFEIGSDGERRYRTLSTHFEIEWLALAFRTTDNKIYVTDWSDERSTGMLEPVATGVMPVDPALAEVDTQEYMGPTPGPVPWFEERSLLYVYYVDDSTDTGSQDNLAYRYAETFTGDGELDGDAFASPEFVNRISEHRELDPVSGVGHKIDFKFARTMYSPSVASKGSLMYLFVIGREMSADNYFVEDPADTLWNDSTEPNSNLIRFGVIRPEGYEYLDPDPHPGKLTWRGERMVLLPRTNVGWVDMDATEHWADDDPTVRYPLLFGSGAGFFSKLRREFHYFFFTGDLPHAMLTVRRSLNP